VDDSSQLEALLVSETTARREAENALATRLELAELVSELSAAFIELPAERLDEGLDEALSVLGTALELDRVSLWRYELARLLLVATHEWAVPGAVRGAPGREQSLTEGSYFGRKLLDGEALVVDSVQAMPAEADHIRVVFERAGVKSFVAVPLAISGEFRGMIIASRSERERPWTAELVATLRLAAQIIVNALERQRSDRELRSRLEFEQTYSRLSVTLSAASVADFGARVGAALESIASALGFDRAVFSNFAGSADFPPVFREWHAPGVAAFSEKHVQPTQDDTEWPVPALVAGELIIAASDELPSTSARAQRLLEDGSWHLHVIAPVRVALRTAAAIALQSRSEPASGRVELASRVQLVSGLLGATLARVEAESERLRTLAALEQLKGSIEAERDFLRQELKGDPASHDLLGKSATLRRVLDAVDAVAPTNAAVLLLGESGVGKELFARAVHERSRRANEPLVKVNCASIPKELFESEFFGHVRGAFTGALKDRAGRFELAHRGTLFLDEVGEIPLELQSKLLRVLQEGELERVGDDRTRKVDVRVVAATNRNLARDVTSGLFRQDLYYRLSVFPIQIPPLRERREDIPLLAEHFLAHCRRTHGRADLEFTEQQLGALVAYDWPGNVRELEHVIERASILAGRTRRLVIELEPRETVPDPAAAPMMTEAELRELSKRSVLTALERSGGRIGGSGGAAELLGLRPSTLRDRMQAFNIKRR
jgi:transcriptional regulator with GAF, ATPase, and Fis domain